MLTNLGSALSGFDAATGLALNLSGGSLRRPPFL